jgi:hypothetical protein
MHPCRVLKAPSRQRRTRVRAAPPRRPGHSPCLASRAARQQCPNPPPLRFRPHVSKPAALTSLPPPRAPAVGRLTSPPSSRVGHRRAARARAPPTPTVYPIHALPSTPRRWGRLANVRAPLESLPPCHSPSTIAHPPLSLPAPPAQASAAARARWSSVPLVLWAAFQRRPSRPLWLSADRPSKRAALVLCTNGPLEIWPSSI